MNDWAPSIVILVIWCAIQISNLNNKVEMILETHKR